MSDSLKDGGPAFPCALNEATSACSPVGMSLRDYACITLKIPETDKDWLNEIILQGKRDELAAMVIGYIAEKITFEERHKLTADGLRAATSRDAYLLVDTMLAERKASP